jgi:hypothetical protein
VRWYLVLLLLFWLLGVVLLLFWCYWNSSLCEVILYDLILQIELVLILIMLLIKFNCSKKKKSTRNTILSIKNNFQVLFLTSDLKLLVDAIYHRCKNPICFDLLFVSSYVCCYGGHFLN